MDDQPLLAQVTCASLRQGPGDSRGSRHEGQEWGQPCWVNELGRGGRLAWSLDPG